ncbi:hypothetical protein SAZ11_47930 [Streptomyces sp. FXJ1.4098]|nr:hypothetical protein [Streptomyces sp. FXJ1.4098]
MAAGQVTEAGGQVTEAGGPRWFVLDGFDRCPQLFDHEAVALAALDLRALRRQRARGIPRRTAVHWRALARLVDPLDQALGALHHDGETVHRRAGSQAAAIVLANCRTLNRSWWGWTSWDWARLCSTGSTAFRTAQQLPTDTATRPFLISLGHLLGGFTDFQHLGNFNRLHLAQLLFGTEPLDAVMDEVAVIADRWGYRSQNREDGRYRLPGVLAQALLINRSPRLEDLTTEAFARLQSHPATSTRYSSGFYALQKIVAELGHCQAPVRPGFNHARAWPAFPSRGRPTCSVGTTPPRSP